MHSLVAFVFALKILTVGALVGIQPILSAVLLALAVYAYFSSRAVRVVLSGNRRLVRAQIGILGVCAAAILVAVVREMPLSDSVLAYSKHIMWPAAFVLGVYLSVSKGHLFSYAYIVVLGGSLLGVSLLMYLLGMGSVEVGGVERLTGFVSQTDLISNSASLLLLLSVGAYFSDLFLERYRWVFLGFVCLSLLALVLSSTLKNIFIAIPLVLLLMGRLGKLRFGKLVAVFPLVLVVLLGVDLDRIYDRIDELFDTGIYIGEEGEHLGNSMNWRLLQWSLVLKDWVDRFLFFGSGIGQVVNMRALQTDDGRGFSAHNDFVSFLAEFGLVGFAIFFYLHVVLYLAISGANSTGKTLRVSYLMLVLCAFFGPMYYTIPWLYMLPFLIGSSLVCRRNV